MQGLQLDASPENKQQQEKQDQSIPPQVWKLCGVPASLQQTQLSAVADAVLQLESVCCPLEVVTCLQRADDAIVTAVNEVRSVLNAASCCCIMNTKMVLVWLIVLGFHVALCWPRHVEHKLNMWTFLPAFCVASLAAALKRVNAWTMGAACANAICF